MRANAFHTLSAAALLLGFACRVTTSQAAIPVGPVGSGVQTFDALPAVTEWSTANIAGAAIDILDAASLDADVNANVSAANVNNALTTSATQPPSQSINARYNTAGQYLQTRATGNKYLVLMATLRNDTGSVQAQLCINEDWDQKNNKPVNEQVPGHRVYFSQTGLPSSWTLVPGLSTFDANSGAQNLTATLPLGAWPAGGILYVIWVDDNGAGSTTDPMEGSYTIDNVAFTFCAPSPPPVITDASSLTNQTVLQCRTAATMSVTATGIGVIYQWVHNGVDIPGASGPTYAIQNMTAADAGNYSVRVFNISGSTNSPTARISYLADTNPPALVLAIGNTNLIEITLTFTEPIDTNQLGDIPFNFMLMDTNTGSLVGITNALAPNNTTLILQTEPRDPTHGHSLKLVGVQDRCAGNPLPDTTVAVYSFYNVLLPVKAVWRYDDTDLDPGPTWFQPGYNDSGWPSGPGPFDAKRDQPAAGGHCRATALFGLGAVGTCINLTSPVTRTNLITANFRSQFYFTGTPGNTILQLIGQVDDGAVVYLNGTEFDRIRMPTGAIIRTTLATGGPADTDPSALLQYAFPSALQTGNNTIAVEIHQNLLTSSDETMGLAVVALTAAPLPVLPHLFILRNPNGSVTITWTGGGTLIGTDNPSASWSPVPGAVSPYTIAAGALTAHRFYSVRVP